MKWRREIEELHDFFERYFAGAEPALARLDAALAPGFSIVSPGGVVSSRAEVMAAIETSHGSSRDLRITTEDHRVILERQDLVVASYVELHHSPGDRSARHSTVVFVADASAPNGVRWLRVHETWV